MIDRRSVLALALLLSAAAFAPVPTVAADAAVASKGLVAVGRMPAALRDKMGETFGSGSGMAINRATWKRVGDGYEGDIYLLPDRGYNVEGTTDYSARLNKLSLKIKPVAPGAKPAAGEEQAGVQATIAETIMLTESNGTALTGLDPTQVRAASGGYPALPQSEGGKISLDPEAVVLMPDGTFFISDEYTPGIFRFAADGKLMGVTRPPEAFWPIRKGELNFSSNNPGPTATAPVPPNPERGRQNNQGLEGMSLSTDGKTLTVVLQSATRQDGGDAPATRNNTRALVYDVADPANLKLVREHVVPLPVFKDDAGKTLVAAQSELLAIDADQFLLLSRDSNNGQGVKGANSLYRKIDILDLRNATNIAGTEFDGAKAVAPKGVLDPSVTPATLRPFIDMNENAQLNRFGLHNGAPNDSNNLSEKWEAMGLVSVMDDAAPDDYLLLVANDNDFLTKDGFQVGAPYDGGADVDTMNLVYRVTLPGVRTRN
ncbi:MAG: phytase-like protein [Hyphomicrobiales bacterium]|nr:phytase-like protein [Hyphomicrobiales bacterium]